MMRRAKTAKEGQALLLCMQTLLFIRMINDYAGKRKAAGKAEGFDSKGCLYVERRKL